jgi:DNA end-binding protein Ku
VPPRPTWKGYLKISLVTVPIQVYPATETRESLTFNQLHEACTTRIQQRRWCQTCGREVANSEIVKGFEFEKGKYVVLLEAELDAVRPPSTRIIDLTQFAPADALDPIAIDRSYYLVPDGARGHVALAFTVLRAALVGRVGIGTLAIYGREYLVGVRVEASTPALVLHTLHPAAAIRSSAALIDGVDVPPTRDLVATARQVITALTRPTLDLTDFTDAYQTDLRRIIDAKIAGEEIVQPPPFQSPAVIDLAQALTLSLQAVTTPTPAKASLRKKRAS